MLKQEGQHCYEYAGVFAGYNVEHVLATFEIGANVQLQCFRLFMVGSVYFVMNCIISHKG
jgi:hypothetical protein